MRLLPIIVFAILLYACDNTPKYKTIDGILEVPENRNNPNSRTLRLVYKVLKAKDTSALKTPIVFLQGGPGAATLSMEPFWENHPLRNDRDIVLMDQRGTGESEANCAEIGDSLLNIMRQNLSLKEDYEATSVLLIECKEIIEQKGIDLAGYSSQENAADFEDLRKTLGYKKWNLFGASYGSRLGLTIMRDFSSGVRSSVFVGVLTPESDLFGDRIKSFENSLFTALQLCAENESCNNRYPDFQERLLKVLKKLQKVPFRFDYKNMPYAVNVQDALALLNFILYSKKSIGNLPFFIDALENRNSEVIINTLEDFESFFNLLNFPMLFSVTAYEELPFYNALDTEKAIEQSEIGLSLAAYNWHAKLLDDWHPYRATDLENQPVISEIPTLMVSGSLDPATPPSNATGALKHLKNGYEIIFPDESHDLFNPCFFQIAVDFLDHPLQKPNMDCGLVRNPIEWNLQPIPSQAK